jgi:hypothetical protein
LLIVGARTFSFFYTVAGDLSRLMGRRQDYIEMITIINVTVESWSDPALLNWRSIDHYWQGFFVGYLEANIDGW